MPLPTSFAGRFHRRATEGRCLEANGRASFFYGNPGDVILAGDWDGDGDDTVAVYRKSSRRIYVNLENTSGAADYTLLVGGYPNAVTAAK